MAKNFLLVIIDRLSDRLSPADPLRAGITGGPKQRPVTAAGMIQIATRPAKARVYLNNKPLCKQTPCLIRNLAPGDYRVVIRHDGYQTWARTIAVKGPAGRLHRPVAAHPARLADPGNGPAVYRSHPPALARGLSA